MPGNNIILVTGGTGFVGQEVVWELLALGYRVRLLVRHPERAARFANHPHVELVKGDVLRPKTLAAAMKDVRAVVHLVGIIAETSKVTFEKAHVEATRNLLTAAKQTGVTRWIQMSAAGTRAAARSRYHVTKWQAEELVRQSGIDWTIFRPSLIYGYDERDRLLNLLRKALSRPWSVILFHTFPLLNGGRPLVQPVSVREVARCFAHAVSKEASLGRTYDLVGPVPFSWREMMFKVAAALGMKCIYEEIPLRIVLRKLLRLTLVFLPILIVVDLAWNKMSLIEAEVGACIWVILMVMTSRQWPLILFSIPSGLLRVVAQGLDAFAPRALRFSEQLLMAEEDNIGDPRPAAETFAYVPETFEQGLARIYGTKA